MAKPRMMAEEDRKIFESRHRHPLPGQANALAGSGADRQKPCRGGDLFARLAVPMVVGVVGFGLLPGLVDDAVA